MKKYYMAYGSNLHRKQMSRRCPDAKIAGTALLEGYRLLFRRSYLTIEPCEGRYVPVAVWEVSEADEKKLDRYEGYPDFYYKKEIPIRTAGGKEEKAFVYIMQDGFALEEPSDYYMQVCQEGYRDFGFDPALLQTALEESRGGQ